MTVKPTIPNRVHVALSYLQMNRSTRAAGCMEQIQTFDVARSEQAAIDSAHRLLIQYFEGHVPDDLQPPPERGPDQQGGLVLLAPYRPPQGGGGAATPAVDAMDTQQPQNTTNTTDRATVDQARMD